MKDTTAAIPKFIAKLDGIFARFEELQTLISDPDVIADETRYPALVKEHGSLAEVAGKYKEYKDVVTEKNDAQHLLDDPSVEEEMRQLAHEEIAQLQQKEEELFEELKGLLVLDSVPTHKSVIIEIRAGTGGEEAALFAADLFRMYAKFAENHRAKVEVMEGNETEKGGFKEIIFSVSGKEAFKIFQFESGGHRVQRVPVTESSGRIHTSAVTVAVLPEVEDIEVDIQPDDLKIETFRASGPGGQHVNKTSSAVRITHIPTGTVVSCQDEKSQHKNKAKAMRILRSRIYDTIESKRRAERDTKRRSLIGSGDRNDRIRTYNFPQNRVTDHRINLNLYSLDKILLGDMDELVEALLEYQKQEMLENLD